MIARERCRDVVKWRRAILRGEIPHAAKVVAIVLHEHMTWKKGSPDAGANCWPSLDTIAEEAGTSRRTVMRALDQLEEAGFIHRLRSPGGRKRGGLGAVNNYAATLPQQGQDDPVQQGRDDPANRDNRASNRDNLSSQQGRDAPRTRYRSTHVTSAHQAGGLNGHREPQTLEDLRTIEFTDPFELGRAIAELCNSGEQIFPDQLTELHREFFDVDDERTTWAGFHRYRVNEDQDVEAYF